MLPLDPFLKHVQQILRLTGKGGLTEGEWRRVRILWQADPSIGPEAIARMWQEGEL